MKSSPCLSYPYAGRDVLGVSASCSADDDDPKQILDGFNIKDVSFRSKSGLNYNLRLFLSLKHRAGFQGPYELWVIYLSLCMGELSWGRPPPNSERPSERRRGARREITRDR